MQLNNQQSKYATEYKKNKIQIQYTTSSNNLKEPW